MNTLSQFFLKLITSFCLITPVSVLAENESKLLIGYGDHDAPPYAIEKAETLYSGIIKDIATEISDELDISVTFVKTPRKRIERYLESDTIHLILMTNPAWLKSEKLQWSDSLLIEKELIVIKADNLTEYQEISDLKGMVIGTIRGYKYPALEDFFDKEYFVRYDVSNLEVNFIRLALSRVDALVGADILINYQLKQNKDAQTFKVLPLTINQNNIQAALSPNAPITITQLNRVLKKLKDQGVIAAILKKYQIDE